MDLIINAAFLCAIVYLIRATIANRRDIDIISSSIINLSTVQNELLLSPEEQMQRYMNSTVTRVDIENSIQKSSINDIMQKKLDRNSDRKSNENSNKNWEGISDLYSD
jgi:hypothetical protein